MADRRDGWCNEVLGLLLISWARCSAVRICNIFLSFSTRDWLIWEILSNAPSPASESVEIYISWTQKEFNVIVDLRVSNTNFLFSEAKFNLLSSLLPYKKLPLKTCSLTFIIFSFFLQTIPVFSHPLPNALPQVAQSTSHRVRMMREENRTRQQVTAHRIQGLKGRTYRKWSGKISGHEYKVFTSWTTTSSARCPPVTKRQL